MHERVKDYFEDVIIPLIAEQSPEVAERMTIGVGGAYGSGHSDDFSDLDCSINVPDELWEKCGGQIQLQIHHLPQERRFLPFPTPHGEMCLNRLSDLARSPYLAGEQAPPWEEDFVSGRLYEIQNTLVVRDPQGLLARLKEATSPSRFPDVLWRKQTILHLKALLADYFGHGDLAACVRRGHDVEATILLGMALHDLCRLTYLVNRTYCPWRKRARLGLAELPPPADAVAVHIDTAVSADNWDVKMETTRKAIDVLTAHIAERRLLPEIDMQASDLADELVWANMFQAWDNPRWHETIAEARKRAVQAGYDPSSWTIWTYWRWIDEEPNEGITTRGSRA